MLSRHQAEPSSQLPRVLERVNVADARHQRARRDRSDPRDRLQSSAIRIALMPVFDLLFDLLRLHVQMPQMLQQSHEQLPAHPWQTVLAIFHDGLDGIFDSPPPLRYHESK